MVITLRNNKKIDLQWSFLVLEYLEEYKTEEGSGINQLRKDIEKKKNNLKINNYFIYAIIRANVDEPLTYREAVCLLKTKDYPTIKKFIEANLNELEEFKKKDKNYIRQEKKKKR